MCTVILNEIAAQTLLLFWYFSSNIIDACTHNSSLWNLRFTWGFIVVLHKIEAIFENFQHNNCEWCVSPNVIQLKLVFFSCDSFSFHSRSYRVLFVFSRKAAFSFALHAMSCEKRCLHFYFASIELSNPG